jgi:hypothetical protein
VAGQLGHGDGVLQRNAILALADAGDARAAAGLPALLVRANYDGDASLDGPDAALRDEDSRAAARANVVEQFLVSACRAPRGVTTTSRSALESDDPPEYDPPRSAPARRGRSENPDVHHRSQPARDRRAGRGRGAPTRRVSFPRPAAGWVLLRRARAPGCWAARASCSPTCLEPRALQGRLPARHRPPGRGQATRRPTARGGARAPDPASDRTGMDGIYALFTTCTHSGASQLAGGGQQVQVSVPRQRLPHVGHQLSPAPRLLERFRIGCGRRAGAGDKSQKFQWEKKQ